MKRTRKGRVRGIYALKRIIHTPKAHGTKKPQGSSPWNIAAKAAYSHAKTEIVCDIQRGYEYRATQQFARAAI